MNDHEHKELVEASWRRVLTPEEEAALQLHLAGHPARQVEWEDDVTLTAALCNLPDAPLSSNFTSQVLQAVEREEAGKERAGNDRALPSRWLWRWLPRFASVTVVLAMLITALSFYRDAHSRNDATRVVATASYVVTALPSPDVLKDFDVIQQLRTAPQFTDEELVAVLLK